MELFAGLIGAAAALLGLAILLSIPLLLIAIYYRLGKANRYLARLIESGRRTIPCLAVLYIGGTLPLPLSPRTPGDLDVLTSAERLAFHFRAGSWIIPYDRMDLIEYSSRDRHLTVHFLDRAGRQQAAIFRLDKSSASATVLSIQVRTGLLRPPPSGPDPRRRPIVSWRPRAKNPSR